ncbi:Uncharacterised protein [Vibrio cholerae]|nr:Uncharacterised protein [Vibrio cholerae]
MILCHFRNPRLDVQYFWLLSSMVVLSASVNFQLTVHSTA